MTRNQIGNFIPGQDKLQSKWHFRDREKLIRERKLGQKWRSERRRLPFPPSESPDGISNNYSLSLSLLLETPPVIKIEIGGEGKKKGRM